MPHTISLPHPLRAHHAYEIPATKAVRKFWKDRDYGAGNNDIIASQDIGRTLFARDNKNPEYEKTAPRLSTCGEIARACRGR